MWIRNQDRTALLDCDNFEVESYSDAPHEVVTLHSRTNITVGLGVYSSKEKALKVLDEIQSVIEDKQFRTIDNVGCGDYVLHNGVQIYEMPQNDDVEI
jgi:hypothetical protein